MVVDNEAELGVLIEKSCRFKIEAAGRERWSSGYGRSLVFKRSWVRILSPCTVRSFFTYICCKNCIVCLENIKNKREKRPGLAHFLKKIEAADAASLAQALSLAWLQYSS